MPIQIRPEMNKMVSVGIDQTTASMRPEYDQYGRYSAFGFDARKCHATQSARMIVGTTIASMMTVELTRIVALPAPTGPSGSRMPPEQAASPLLDRPRIEPR